MAVAIRDGERFGLTADDNPRRLRVEAEDGIVTDLERELAPRTGLLLRGLLFRFGMSVMSDAVEMVPTGGELTLFEAVGRWA